MSSSNEDSNSRRSYPGHAEVLVLGATTCAMSSQANSTATVSSSTSLKVGALPVVVSATSSTVTTALAASSSGNPTNCNKKHNLGYRLRRLLFPQFRTTTGTTLNKHKVAKDGEKTENQNFLRHSSSFYSTSSGESELRGSRKGRRPTRNQSQQTDTLPEFPSLPTYPNASPSVAWPNTQGLFECSICLLEQALAQYPELSTCHHRACLTCLRQYLRIEIFESRINITCPECSEQLHPNDIKTILRHDANLIEKYESFMVRRILITDPDARWCPAPDCDYCVIASGCASCPKLKCQRPGCETLFCYHCKQEWHPNQTCDQARAQRGKGKAGAGVTFSTSSPDSAGHSSASGDASYLQRDDIKPCPCCKVLIIKQDDGSCNHLTCSVCGTEFCWLCMKQISDLHYLSPSGCTFWGKKPWSRKKKIMWQLGMLVGAPVGIALIAGIAVPAIIIGIPVWVGRKLYARFERNHLSRPKSNLLVTTGVLTSIFVSPILAAVAVGIGVPILLAYVYGVVPISLCRSGGCGVITSSSGVRIELDEDEISANVAPDGVSVDTILSGHRAITNPSIGEVSLGMSTSLSIGSSSHLDRVVLDIQPDRESSSIVACAGSITSNMLNNNVHVSANHNKLDTHADVISNKRFSFSSQNADASSVTLSVGDRSINTNISGDDASLKVLTGSIREGPSQATAHYSLSPVEVHVNLCLHEEDKSTQTTQSKPKAQVTPLEQAANSVLGKYESRSLEYLTSNYCKFCYKSHKPCCPNFQHPNGGATTTTTTIAIGKLTPENADKPGTSESSCQIKSSDASSDTLTEVENAICVNEIEIVEQATVYDCDTQLPSCRADSFATGSSTLSKKAQSQIFYPSSHYSTASGESVGHRTKGDNSCPPKSGLSHSLSFSINNNHHLIGEHEGSGTGSSGKHGYML